MTEFNELLELLGIMLLSGLALGLGFSIVIFFFAWLKSSQ
jgi:hypothetical protein